MRNQFDMNLALYGYKGLDNSQLVKKSVIETKNLIGSLNLPSITSITDIAVKPQNLGRQSKKIITSLLPDLNREVRVISINDYLKTAFKLKNGEISIEEYLKTLKKQSFRTDAVNAPLTFSNKVHCTRALVIKPFVLIDNDEFLKNAPIYISGYELGNIQLSRLGIITHLHEITHALLERNKGSVEDYYKSELLSILMEKIAALEIDTTSVLLSKQNIYRYEDLKNNINNINDQESHKYLLSTLLAEILFDKYEKGNETYKLHILSQISKVLSGEIVLERMLIEEGIVLDNNNIPCIIDEKIQKSIKNLK